MCLGKRSLLHRTSDDRPPPFVPLAGLGRKPISLVLPVALAHLVLGLRAAPGPAGLNTQRTTPDYHLAVILISPILRKPSPSIRRGFSPCPS
jgi:hypothetical protein